MEILLYFVLVLALVGDVLLAILLVRSSRPQKPQGPTADDVVNAMTPVLQGETDLLAEQLRAMQGESARTTTATLRDFSAGVGREPAPNAAAAPPGWSPSTAPGPPPEGRQRCADCPAYDDGDPPEEP